MLTVTLSRDRLPITSPAGSTPLSTPSLLTQAGTALTSVTEWLLAGAPIVDDSVHLTRAVECSLCPRFDARAQRCLECGCYAIKLRLATESCPLARW